MENGIIDFFKKSLEDKDLFDSVVKAENEDELYNIYKKLNGDCDKETFVKSINKLIEDALSACGLEDSDLEVVTGGINNMRSNDISRKIISSVLAISSLSVPMSSVSAQYHSDDSYRRYQNTELNSFFKEHPNLKKVAIGGGVVGVGALSLGALYLLLHNSDRGEKVDQTASANDPKARTHKPSIPFSKYTHNFNQRMIGYNEKYWPGGLRGGHLIDRNNPDDMSALKRIHFIQGSIVKLYDQKRLAVDVIVNAANPSLIRGGGVCGHIFGGAGNELGNEIQDLKTALSINSLGTGAAVITNAHNLSATQGLRAIIHTPGPNLQGRNGVVGENDRKQLASSYGSSIELAAANGFTSIAFPSISTNIYCFPVAEACPIAISSVIKALKEHGSMQVYFVVYPGSNEETTYLAMMNSLGKSYED